MKKLLLCTAMLGILLPAVAQDSFSELESMPEKKLEKLFYVWNPGRVDTKTGTGIAPDLSKKEINTVALAAYTIYAPDVWAKYSANISVLTEAGVTHFADKLYQNSIEAMKKAFAEGGMDLITREMMNADQKAILEEGITNKWFSDLEWNQARVESAYEKVEEKSIKIGAAAEGYRNWTVYEGVPTPWTNTMLAGIAEGLGVDAVLLISNRIDLSKNVGYATTYMTMVGKNPIPKIEGKKYPGLSYSDGMYYSQVGLRMSKPIEIAVIKRKHIQTENYEGFDAAMKILVNRMLADIKFRTENPTGKKK